MTLQAKPKQCSFCGQVKPLWKSNPKTCKECHGRNRQAESEREPWYAAAEGEFLEKTKQEAEELYNMKRKPLKAKPKPTVNGRLIHTAIYMAAFGYGDTDYIPSELSGDPCVDLHHIDCKGSGGSKSKDRIENIIGLTRGEHIEYGDKKQWMSFLYMKHMDFMLQSGVRFDRDWIQGEIDRWESCAE